ncbi:hypothetical protein [Pyrinomonas methylaliphatogenes]|jgi:hypothetical protein|uniref:Uncharacterized protein n=1 Tax=Pyrinomonas methylaliphatogenes TaxID=454194 RepID=A0A0B6WUF1_9BACT|nr:hypothetical protein [Pyrinomonas methylaliphatogenes]MBX5478894.1 hypothetical protein [Pyrinomonas methylaliphatogenes]CDM64606.1 hypothetical protein PYK22_00600 [Pyrinomonas methylaliphatogenes]
MVRVAVIGLDEVYRQGVFVEWESAYPARTLRQLPDGTCLIPPEWLDDLRRIAAECCSEVRVINEPKASRRDFLRRFAPKL